MSDANERAWILSDNTSSSSETRDTGIIRNILYSLGLHFGNR